MYKTFCDVCESETGREALGKDRYMIDDEVVLNGKRSNRLHVQVTVWGIGGAPAQHLCDDCFQRLMGMFDNRPKAAGAG